MARPTGSVFNRLSAIILSAGMVAGAAQAEPLDREWRLDNDASSLTFQSVKNNSKVETSSFATLDGEIDETGEARVRVKLESVDTKVDLRNVRMRFLFFETFTHPEATITTQVSPDILEQLAERRRVTFPLPYSLDLHGVTKGLEASVVATLITDEMVSVASTEPISILTKDFDLDEGVAKLQDAAKVEIVPSASVSFDFVFRKAPGPDASEAVAATAEPDPEDQPVSAALEPSGNLDAEACIGRFEILSRTGAIYFKLGSADLDPDSAPLLRTVVDIIERCPGLNIVVAGHTDSSGDETFNQLLSERRAGAVSTYLLNRGIEPARIRSVGFGETSPVAPNDTIRNRGRNRRIEFQPSDS